MALAALALLGLALRLAVLASPLGELDGDEAVVGLMARHIALLGDRPVFYYGQPYLGSLEAFTAAPLFWLFGSSTFLLKLVPAAYSLGFLLLSALLARGLFGQGPALITAAYLAAPPAMWAVWSTKARGGYAEVLCLGEAFLLATLWLAERRRPAWGGLLWGALGGLALWTHLLAAVYLLPCTVYLLARRRRWWSPAEAGEAAVGFAVGAAPMLVHNVANGFPTVAALLQPADLALDPGAQLLRFFRVGVPVLAGLGQPTTSAAMFDHDWLNRPAGRLPVAIALVASLGAVVVRHAAAIWRLCGRTPGQHTGPALLVLVAVAVPPVVALSRFGFLVAEPRYALPLYSTVPLLAYALWRLPRLARLAGVAAVLALNVWSLLTTDVRLWRPEEAVDSTAETRAALVANLVAEDRHQMYTDYWIGYPVMFETRETVLAYVVSGGFNRYVPPADNVQRTPNAVWVFMPGSEAEQEFLARLRAIGGSARVEEVSVYRVYKDVAPIDAMRPPW
jgi:4-amino-4-deoxy-L-arabinose transferase-like glycosyltransferase